MLFHIEHVTRFSYSAAVFCEPLLIRLRPREEAAQRLLEFDLRVAPPPAGATDYIDAAGNGVRRLWFSGQLSELSIESRHKVETSRANPFDFVLPDRALRLPLENVAGEPMWDAFLRPDGGAAAAGELANEVRAAAGGDTLAFLSQLADRLHRELRTIYRPEGAAWPADETLSRGEGSCRDLAVVYNEACRTQGIPARFVSGYSGCGEEAAQSELHAWSEVYLPGAGWRGYDPTLGLAVADLHVAVAAAPFPPGAAPTQGSFRGGAASEISTHVKVVVS